MRHFVPVALVALSSVAVVVAGPPAADDTARVYRVDTAHSHVDFTARYLRIMEVEGRFREWDAAIIGPEEPTGGAIALVLKTASLDTGNQSRDDHLRSPDFFDAERWPVIVFRSSRIERRGDGFLARGTLEMHGVSKEIEVPFRAAYAPMTDGKGNRRVGFTGETTIDRKAFGIVGGNRFNSGFDPLVSIIDDEVKISFGLHGMIPAVRAAAVDSLVDQVAKSGLAEVVRLWHANPPVGESEEAKRAANRAAAIFNAAGYRLLDEGRGEDAVELLRLAVLSAPGSARALSGLAEGYARIGKVAPARENVEKTLAIDPHEARALALAVWLEGRGT